MGYCVYLVTNTVNGKRYVGKTDDMEYRWWRHRNSASRSEETALYRAIRKYGEAAFTCELLEACESEAHAFEREVYWIAELKTFGHGGYNMTAGGEGPSGLKQPEASKPLMARSGPLNGMSGRTHTPETREKLSAAARSQMERDGHPWLGRKHSKESREKMSRAAMGHKRCVGRKYSAETLAKMSASHRGQPAHNKGKPGKPHTEERKAAQAEKMRAYWSRRKAEAAADGIQRTRSGSD